MSADTLPTVDFLGVPVWRWYAFECGKRHRWARLMEDLGVPPHSRCPACLSDELHRAEVVVSWVEAPPKQRGAQAATTPAEPKPKPKPKPAAHWTTIEADPATWPPDTDDLVIVFDPMFGASALRGSTVRHSAKGDGDVIGKSWIRAPEGS